MLIQKAVIAGQNLMAKGAMILTDATGDVSDTTETVEETLSLVQKINEFFEKDWVQATGSVLLFTACIVVVGVLLIKPAIRKAKKR